MSRFPLVVATALAGVSLASAEMRLGDNANLFLTAVGSLRFDDNVRLADAGRDADTVFVAIPGLEWKYDAAPTTATLAVSEQFVRYASNSDLNANLASVVASAKYDGPVTQVTGGASYRELSQNGLAIRSAEQTIRRALSAVSTDVLWAGTAKTRVGTGVSLERTDYWQSGYIDVSYLSLPLDVYYAATAKVDVGLGYRFRRTDTQQALFNSKDHFLSLVAKGDFTPKLGGKVRIGYNRRGFDRGGSQGQLGVGASVTYVYSPKTSFELMASNDFANSALGASQRVFATVIAVRTQFNQRWSGQAEVSFEASSYQSGRHDDFVVGQVTATYTVSERFACEATVISRRNASNTAGRDFSNNLLSLSGSFRY